MSNKITLVKSVGYAFRGLTSVWKEEINFRIEIFCAGLDLLASWFFHFSYIEVAILVLVIVVILAGEIVNTAIEDLCDKVEPRQDILIGKVKDIMAGFVLVGALGAVLIGLVVFTFHFL